MRRISVTNFKPVRSYYSPLYRPNYFSIKPVNLSSMIKSGYRRLPIESLNLSYIRYLSVGNQGETKSTNKQEEIKSTNKQDIKVNSEVKNNDEGNNYGHNNGEKHNDKKDDKKKWNYKKIGLGLFIAVGALETILIVSNNYFGISKLPFTPYEYYPLSRDFTTYLKTLRYKEIKSLQELYGVCKASGRLISIEDLFKIESNVVQIYDGYKTLVVDRLIPGAYLLDYIEYKCGFGTHDELLDYALKFIMLTNEMVDGRENNLSQIQKNGLSNANKNESANANKNESANTNKDEWLKYGNFFSVLHTNNVSLLWTYLTSNNRLDAKELINDEYFWPMLDELESRGRFDVPRIQDVLCKYFHRTLGHDMFTREWGQSMLTKINENYGKRLMNVRYAGKSPVYPRRMMEFIDALTRGLCASVLCDVRDGDE